jgi:hypothetical protein
MIETIEQRPTRREVLPYNGIRANTQPLCPEFWSQVTGGHKDDAIWELMFFGHARDQ